MLLLAPTRECRAEVGNGGYAFQDTTGTYTPITTLPFAVGDFPGLPSPRYQRSIGFDFTFNGVTRNTVWIAPFGWLAFTTGDPGFFTNPISNVSGSQAVAAAGGNLFGRTILPWTTMRDETTGTPGSRVYTVQWADHAFSGADQNHNLHWQIKLYEGTNVVEIVYGSMTGTLAGWPAGTGLRGLTPSDFLVVQQNVPGQWGTPGTGLTVNSTNASTTWTFTGAAGGFPNSGRLLRFTPAIDALSVNDIAVAEGDSGTRTGTMTISVSARTNTPIDVTVNTVEGTALSSGGSPDFVAISSQVVSIPAGVTTATVDVDVLGDFSGELDESFTVVLSSPTAGMLFDPVGTVTIADDDLACGAVQDFALATQTDPSATGWTRVNNSFGNVAWEFGAPVTYDPPPTSAIVVAPPIVAPYAVINNDAATGAADAELRSPSLDLTGTSLVIVSFDEIYRGSATSQASIEISTNGGGSWTPIVPDRLTANVGSHSTGVSAHSSVDVSSIAANQADVRLRFRFIGSSSRWWIIDNVGICTDVPAGSSTVIADLIGTSAYETAGTLTASVTLKPPAAAPIELNIDAAGGTAAVGVNYAPPPSTLSFALGETSADVVYTIFPDGVFTPPLTYFTRVVSAASGPFFLPRTFGPPSGPYSATRSRIRNLDLPSIPVAFANDLGTGEHAFLRLDGTGPVEVDTSDIYAGGDFDGATGEYFSAFEFARLDRIAPITGVVTPGPAITGMLANHGVVSLSWNPADGKMWAMTLDLSDFIGTQIGTIDTSTGVFNSAYTGASMVGVAIAHSATGDAFVVTGTSSGASPLSLSRYTAPSTVVSVGALGRDSFEFLEADFDPQTGTLWMPIRDTTTNSSALYSINTTTGASTRVGALHTPATKSFSAFGVMRAYTPLLTVNDTYGVSSESTGTRPWGTSITATIPPTFQASADERIEVTGWTGTGDVPASGTGTSTTFELRVPSTLTWLYEQEFNLTLSVTPPGAGTFVTVPGYYANGAAVTLEVVPNASYNFVGFIGDVTSSTNPTGITMDSPKSVTAQFAGSSAVSGSWMLLE